jgi:hypothetical protein
LKTNSASLKTSSAGFCTVHFFLASLWVCCVSQKQCAAFWKTGSTSFGTDSTDFDSGPPTSWANHWTEKHSSRNRLNRFLGPAQPVFGKKSPTATSFWGLLYIPLSLSLFIRFCPSTNSWLTYTQTRALTPPLTPKIASPSIDWRTLGVRWSLSNSLVISSLFSLSLHLLSWLQTWILCGFVTLGTLCSLTDGGCMRVSKFVDDPKKFVSPARWAKLRKDCLDLGGRLVKD